MTRKLPERVVWRVSLPAGVVLDANRAGLTDRDLDALVEKALVEWTWRRAS
jgi:hypothetical protein